MNKTFTIGDRVVFEENTTTYANGKDLSKEIGKVVKVFDGLNMVLADFGSEVVKIPVMFLTPAPEEKPEGKAQAVKLTLDDFREYAVKFTSLKFIEELFDGEDITEGGVVSFASAAAIIFDNLENMIFGDPND